MLLKIVILISLLSLFILSCKKSKWKFKTIVCTNYCKDSTGQIKITAKNISKYNSVGRLIEVETYYGNNSLKLYEKSSFKYNSCGLETENIATDSLGKRVFYEYWKYNDSGKIIYDSTDYCHKATDLLYFVQTYVYNDRGKLITYNNIWYLEHNKTKMFQRIHYKYYKDDKIIEDYDSNWYNKLTKMLFYDDAKGRDTLLNYYDTNGNLYKTVHEKYDSTSNLIYLSNSDSIHNDSYTYRYEYDSLNNCTREVYRNQSFPYSNYDNGWKYGYDKYGNWIKKTYLMHGKENGNYSTRDIAYY